MNPATWAWLGLVVLLTAYVLGFDLWAQATNHDTMSAQIHVWMQSQLAGPIVTGLWVGVSSALLYHFVINK
jgi:hypothetical protein